MRLRILALRNIPDDERLREQWDALVQGMERPEVFYTYEWAISVQRSYGSILRPLLLLGYDDESLVGVAALALRPSGELSFLSESTADYCDLLSAPNLRGRWCDAVFRELRSLSAGSVVLANLPADSLTASVLREAARKYGYRSFIRPAYSCARIVFRDDEYPTALQRNKKLLRRNRLLNGKGPAAFSPNVATEQLDEVVSTFCRAHVTRFLASGRFSNMTRPERRRFLTELARELSPRGWLSISRLLVGDRCVAWNYGFQFADSWFWYQPTFDTNYERFSPGLCLLGKIVESAYDSRQIKVVDLGLGAEGYKKRIATESRETLHATLTRSSVLCAKTVLRYRIAEAVKGRPEAERRIHASLDRLARWRSFVRKEGLLASASHVAKRVRGRIMGGREVHFFQWCGDRGVTFVEKLSIRELDADLLGVAAMEYHDDQATLEYLLRAAQRLRTGSNQGYALLTGIGTPVHFCWVSDFERFEMQELQQHLTAPQRGAVLIFDCWSPLAVRGRGYFATAIAALANRLWVSGEMPWIFAAAKNYASLKGVREAGFIHRFTMRQRRFLGLKKAVEMAYCAADSLAPVVATVHGCAHSEN